MVLHQWLYNTSGHHHEGAHVEKKDGRWHTAWTRGNGF
jgi:hypothetical protein